ncbi:MAG TPA: homoserine kinase [Atribacteraceae bacterium]|nr:homoserine kinase [Atribacteraceae bacterium]
MFEIRVPATTANLGCGFDVAGLALTLYFTVRVSEVGDSLSIVNTGEGEGFLPNNEGHLFFRAMRAFWKEIGFPGCGVQSKAHNEIPVSRGLGSSASCVVAGMVTGNRLAGNLCSREDLMTMAARFEGHPDNVVPAFVGGLTTSYLGMKRIAYRRFSFFPDFEIVACVPGYSLYTAGMRQILPERYSRRDVVFTLSRLAHLVGSVAQRDRDGFLDALDDVIHEPYRGERIIGYRAIKDFIEREGLGRVVISGSGPTLLLFLREELTDAVSRDVRKLFASCGVPNIQLIKTKWAEEGVRVNDI